MSFRVYDRIVMLPQDISEYKFSDFKTIYLLKEERYLIAYWRKVNSIGRKFLPVSEVGEIIKLLPSSTSRNPKLIQTIISKYHCDSNLIEIDTRSKMEKQTNALINDVTGSLRRWCSSVSMLHEKDSVPVKIPDNVIFMQKKDGILNAYWMKDSQCVHKSVDDLYIQVNFSKNFNEKLPPSGESSVDANLIHEITSKFFYDPGNNRFLYDNDRKKEIIEGIKNIKQTEEFLLGLIAELFIRADRFHYGAEQEKTLEPMFHKAHKENKKYKQKQSVIAKNNRKEKPSIEDLMNVKNNYETEYGRFHGWKKVACDEFSISLKTLNKILKP